MALSGTAVRILLDEFLRHPGPKTGTLVGVDARSPLVPAALDGLLPEDSLTLVAGADDVAALRDVITGQGRWVAQRVRVLDTPAQAPPADVVVAASPVRNGNLEALRELVAPGGVLTVAAPAHDSAAIRRLARTYGVVSDVVLGNRPPLVVHRLRFAPADHRDAGGLAPARRTSSVGLTRRMRIDANGLAAAGVCAGAAAISKLVRPGSKLWLLPAMAAVPVAAFFRDPERIAPTDPDAVAAASDGTVLHVDEVCDERFGPDAWLRIAVFLSVLDVHVNRAPFAGRVVDIVRESGGYAPAMKPAAEHNVAAYTVLETPQGRVVIAQRTGLIARRIVNRTRVGALLARGERFGLIRFGSRTDVYLPAKSADPLVSPGDRVAGGATVIARWRSQTSGPLAR